MDLRDSSSKYKHAAVVAFTVFDVPFVHQMPATSRQSSDAVDNGSQASRKVKPG